MKKGSRKLSDRYHSDIDRVINIISKNVNYKKPRRKWTFPICLLGLALCAADLSVRFFPNIEARWNHDIMIFVIGSITAIAAALYQMPALKMRAPRKHHDAIPRGIPKLTLISSKHEDK